MSVEPRTQSASTEIGFTDRNWLLQIIVLPFIPFGNLET